MQHELIMITSWLVFSNEILSNEQIFEFSHHKTISQNIINRQLKWRYRINFFLDMLDFWNWYSKRCCDVIIIVEPIALSNDVCELLVVDHAIRVFVQGQDGFVHDLL